ncbi:MAG: lysylphosphatidylglycerol synthase domain-containing protein [Chitinophagales bacterium]
MNKTAQLLLKLLVGLVLFALLYLQLSSSQLRFLFVYDDFRQHLSATKLPLLFAAVLLMPLNWYLEAVKWGVLLNRNYSTTTLLRGVIAGVTMGFVTPARSGEFLGRVIFLNDTDRVRSFYLTAIGGMAQAVPTYAMGAICVALLGSTIIPGFEFVTGLAIGLATVFIFFYFRFEFLNALIRRLPFLANRNLIIDKDEIPPPAILTKTLAIAILRYSIYVAQYVLLALFFCQGKDLNALIIGTGALLVLQSLSPLTPFLDVPLRGVMALTVFGVLLDENRIGILFTVAAIVLINLAIPALVGYIFILNRRLPSPQTINTLQ